MLPVQRDRALSILRLGHQLQVRLLHQYRGKAGPNDGVIVGHEDADPSIGIARAFVPTHPIFSSTEDARRNRFTGRGAIPRSGETGRYLIGGAPRSNSPGAVPPNLPGIGQKLPVIGQRTSNAEEHMRIRMRQIALGIGLILAAGCAGQQVTTDYSPATSFSQFRTFALVAPPDTAAQQLLDQRVRNAVQAQLDAKGLTGRSPECRPLRRLRDGR